MPGRVKDLTGQTFGKLKVIKQVPRPENASAKRGAWWLCECECGNTIEVSGAKLKIGDRTTCGCFQNPNHVGKRFGWLKVIEKAPSRFEYGKNRSYWKCECDCGKICEVAGNSLVTEDTRSCGCMKRPDLTGRRFGKLVVLERVEATDPRNGTQFGKQLVRCDCGSEFLVRADHLLDGNPDLKACQDCRVPASKTHGMSNTRTYEIWCGMKRRCLNQNDQAYDRYGGAGITVCDRWIDSFEAFFEDMGEAPEGMSIDRFPDKLGSYEPGNCRWATDQEQAENKTNNFWITANKGTPEEETHTVTEWGRIKGICHATISYRIRILGWDEDTALNTPVDPVISERSKAPKNRKKKSA